MEMVSYFLYETNVRDLAVLRQTATSLQAVFHVKSKTFSTFFICGGRTHCGAVWRTNAKPYWLYVDL